MQVKHMRRMKWTSVIRLSAQGAELGIFVGRIWGWSGEFCRFCRCFDLQVTNRRVVVDAMERRTVNVSERTTVGLRGWLSAAAVLYETLVYRDMGASDSRGISRVLRDWQIRPGRGIRSVSQRDGIEDVYGTHKYIHNARLPSIYRAYL
jgi:hypothetical protein